ACCTPGRLCAEDRQRLDFAAGWIAFLDSPATSSVFPLFATFPHSLGTPLQPMLEPTRARWRAIGGIHGMVSGRTWLVQITSCVALVIMSLSAATQWAAAMLGYQPALGQPLLNLLGLKLYAPWQLFIWWLAFDAQAPDVFVRAGALAAF